MGLAYPLCINDHTGLLCYSNHFCCSGIRSRNCQHLQCPAISFDLGAVQRIDLCHYWRLVVIGGLALISSGSGMSGGPGTCQSLRGGRSDQQTAVETIDHYMAAQHRVSLSSITLICVVRLNRFCPPLNLWSRIRGVPKSSFYSAA